PSSVTKNLAGCFKTVQLRGGARSSHARRTLCGGVRSHVGPPQTNNRRVPSAHVLLGMASEDANEADGPFSAACACGGRRALLDSHACEDAACSEPIDRRRTPMPFPLTMSDPASLGLDPKQLERLGEIITRHLTDGRYPGAQIAVARRGKLALVR